MIGEAFQNLGLLAGDAVVDDGVDDLAGRDGALDGADEAGELLVAMAPHAAPDHRSAEDDERGEQCRRAAALVVAGRPPAFAVRERQARRRAVGGLNSAFLVDRRHDRVLGRSIAIVGGREDANSLRPADRSAHRSAFVNRPIVSRH
jgi:hypothetical protein